VSQVQVARLAWPEARRAGAHRRWAISLEAASRARQQDSSLGNVHTKGGGVRLVRALHCAALSNRDRERFQ
jgi:hypothetical protein